MFELSDFTGLYSSWERLKNTDKPVFVYGMGDGCLKLFSQFERFGIKPAGIFASDEFVRGHSFLGYEVKTLSRVEQENPDGFVIALAFAAGYRELIDKIDRIAERHELIMPDTAVIGGEPFLKETLEQNIDDAKRVFENLADDKSREVFKNVLKYKITGDISFLKECETDPCETYQSILKPSAGEVYVDLGAYNGDTVKEYTSFAKDYEKIYALEPNARNFRKLSEYLNTIDCAEAVNAAAWDKCEEIMFSKGGGRQSHAQAKGVPTKAVSVDSLLGGGRADYIKYDVEGEERRAIAGSAETIKRFSPKLCVAVYHRLLDMFELPNQIKSLCPDYKMYLRHYPYYPAWETNLITVKN